MEKKKKNISNKLIIRRTIIIVILILLIILLLFGIKSLVNLIFSGERVVGNLNNRGLAAESGNEVYYNKYEKGIVKVKGGKEYQITDETAYSMTVIDNIIYFLTVSDTNTIDLKKVETNGNNLTKIKTLSTPISKFYIEDNYLYYITDKDVVGISKLELATGQETTITSANVQDFILEKGIIYFTDNVGYLHSVNINGTDNKAISKDYNIKKIQILKKWIYYYDEKEKALCKIKKDGSSRTVVSKFVNNEIYNVTNKGIFYYDSANKKISKCDLKGKKSKEIVSLNISNTKINIVDDIIYYLDKSKDEKQIYQMYRVKKNGGAAKAIEY